MRINVASKNPVKIDAVKRVILDYPLLSKAQVIPIEVSSRVSEQPNNLEETVMGSITRAKASFQDCDYSVGLESGLMEVPRSKTGYMDVCVCAIYNGKDHYLGISRGFELPLNVVKRIFQEGLDINDAFLAEKLTKDKRIGSSEGAIGILTKGRVNRQQYTEDAIKMALIQLENPDLY
ncbi:inosine/xanthosine triphosphatase [Candidatus Pacearchaeota archaeon]|nr:inosine/xanthosine triphosphatase [Candidatus Pacearchaeota archaeon]